MIPALIIWLCKKYIAPRIQKRNLLQKASALKVQALAFIFMAATTQLFAQQQNSKYNIKRNGEVIGQMHFSQKDDGTNTFLKITSKVNTRFVFKIDVETEDVAHFKNGRLISSGVNRVVNGDPKEFKKTSLQNEVYQVQAGKKISIIKQPIVYSMMLLYSSEPVNITEVYSDNFQCFVPVQKKGNHQYRITLPDGNYNDYQFENGICRTVTVNHSLYTIKMERV
ncbi:DUF6134 family protein [Pedobacter punctiformis]|uniref:Uncharacterized protein n=1 Tax=Pedobacter punctiformis TaxID=3004097 RepID=A0ABT4LEL1_9SPHI|nr:DUF6134 family protein [Pedobacter sp. HCMS5-2]MCZ4245279.1 hypothetical protein [Pedobacter sp. HCMS5-2]